MKLYWMVLCGVAAVGCGDDSMGEPVPATFPMTTHGGSHTGSGGTSPTTGVEGTSGSAASTDDDGGDDTAGVKFDLPAPDVGDEACDPRDVCCLEPGVLPPHALLDAFILAYPAAAMPESHDEVTAFMPTADGHAMSFNLDQVGDEFVDPDQGGVIPENLEAGRAFSKTFADMTIPPTATVLDTCEDPTEVKNLAGGGTGCVGTGWGWGSMLFEAADLSIREVVYLYVGYCEDGDSEAFFYSEEAVEICAPPG
ncbi:MAG: hypothetical protein AAF721_08545 [Myxococcota bacterium]